MPTITPKPGTADYVKQLANWGEDIRPQQYVAIIICMTAATASVAARIYSQKVYRRNFDLADASIVIALIIVYAQSIASFLSMEDGAGLHQLRVLSEDQNAPYGLQHMYTVSLASDQRLPCVG